MNRIVSSEMKAKKRNSNESPEERQHPRTPFIIIIIFHQRFFISSLSNTSSVVELKVGISIGVMDWYIA